MAERTCGTQFYWYEDGVQCGRFCGKPATRRTRAGFSTTDACDEYADNAVEAGAEDVTGEA